MTQDEKIALSLEAERLLADDTVNRALDDMRLVAIAALLNTKAEDTAEIIRWQSYVGAIDAFRGQLGIYVTQGKPQMTRGSVA